MTRNDEGHTKNPARLKGEAWFDVEKIKTLSDNGNPKAKALAKKLANGEDIDVSTGLVTEDKFGNGKFNGKEYNVIARNHSPDHLAILPLSKGACSNADGCGLPRVNSADDQSPQVDQEALISKMVNRFTSAIGSMLGVKNNELTSNDKRVALERLLMQKTMQRERQNSCRH